MACENEGALTEQDIDDISVNVKAVNEWAEGGPTDSATMANGLVVPSPSKVIANSRLFKPTIPWPGAGTVTDAAQAYTGDDDVIYAANPTALPLTVTGVFATDIAVAGAWYMIAYKDMPRIAVDLAAAKLLTPTPGAALIIMSAEGDGSVWRALTGDPPGTHSDDDPGSLGTVFIPTGGDGSTAWETTGSRFDQKLTGFNVTGFTMFSGADLDTFFSNGQTAINSNVNTPIGTDRGILTVHMSPDDQSGVQWVESVAGTTKGEIHRRLLSTGTWPGAWEEMTAGKTILLGTPVVVVASSSLNGVWTTASDAVTTSAKAKAAILRIRLNSFSISATSAKVEGYIRQTGSGDAANQVTKIAEAEQQISAAGVINAPTACEITVPLDATYQFDWQTVADQTAGTTIYLAGYVT